MNLRHLPWQKAVMAGVCAAGLLAGALGAISPAGAVDQDPQFYLALGGSNSVGFQPTAANPHGHRTDQGYADDLLDSERARWSDLRLVQLGCPGETTVTMLNSGDHCDYSAGSQLAAALSFLRQHSSTVLMTVDLGFNNVERCMTHQMVDESCVTLALENIRAQLPRILASLQSAGGPTLHIVGVGHYDPYLASYLDGSAGQSFASQSLDVISQLNDVMRTAYATAGIPMADVATAFDMTSTKPTSLPGTGLVPRNVERSCALTWECAPAPLGPNKHPNDAGYQVIGEVISDVVTGP